ncbi:single hybrid motif superfamily protein [Actinidia rufa]|uniref:Single hybrid motif superfamily protein n=1 Tax=Actinidia rufa TaxID=165716 RepID=A0A7J0GI44_9ERIC|nr:single hybrid motif superfamily protein [Actinidia rufa]
MEEPKVQDANNDPQSTDEKLNPISSSSSSSSSSSNSTEQLQQPESVEDEEELKRLLVPDVRDLPLIPPSAVESNFVPYFAPDFIKPGHDQYVYRHANGLCVIGLALAHLAFKDDGGVTAVDFNVGKSDRSGIKVTGKRKKAEREGYIAIIMPKPADWLKAKSLLLGVDEYKKLRELF